MSNKKNILHAFMWTQITSLTYPSHIALLILSFSEMLLGDVFAVHIARGMYAIYNLQMR